MARTKKKDYGSGSFRKRGKKYEYRFSYSALDGRFLKSVPLHHSQTILTDTENEFRISVRLRITNDFVIELLSRSTSLTVIKPASLRRRVAEIYEKALYRNMDK